MAKAKGDEGEERKKAPALTIEQMESAVLLLMDGRHNTWAGELARPEKIQARRERAARALRNEAVRIGEQAERIAAENLGRR